MLSVLFSNNNKSLKINNEIKDYIKIQTKESMNKKICLFKKNIINNKKINII
jgi:hypothetical protein